MYIYESYGNSRFKNKRILIHIEKHMTKDYNKFQQKKVQCVKGSYYVYLPKNWATKYGLDDDRRILIKRMKDDSLIIKAMNVETHIEDTYKINLDINGNILEDIEKEEYIDYLFNLFLTAYIIGYKRVIFHKTSKISLELQNRISQMTKRFHGMVIMEEDKKRIVVEDTSNSVNLKLLVKQIINKVGIQISNLIEIFENYSDLKEKSKLEKFTGELIKQDDQIDEHRYAIERTVHQILNYPSLGMDLGITTVECLHYSECARMLERIGDYILKLARCLIEEEIDDYNLLKRRMYSMRETYNIIQDYFFRTDTFKFYSLVKSIDEDAAEMKSIIKDDHPDKSFLHPIRRIKNICTDISEIRINDIVAHKDQLPD